MLKLWVFSPSLCFFLCVFVSMSVSVSLFLSEDTSHSDLHWWASLLLDLQFRKQDSLPSTTLQADTISHAEYLTGLACCFSLKVWHNGFWVSLNFVLKFFLKPAKGTICSSVTNIPLYLFFPKWPEWICLFSLLFSSTCPFNWYIEDEGPSIESYQSADSWPKNSSYFRALLESYM